MSTQSYAIRDSATMLRRNLRHVLRYPGMTFGVLGTPVVMLLLFRYVFGGTLGAGIGSAGHGGYVSVLTGHVSGSVIQTVTSAALVTGLAVAMGFRPTASAAGWIAATALIVAVAFALTWVSVALGLMAKTPENASNLPTPLVFLPFLGSAFIPPQSMAPGLRWFAEYQPFTPIIETLRGLLTGTPIGDSALIAAAWCAGLALAGYVSARALFNRGAAR